MRKHLSPVLFAVLVLASAAAAASPQSSGDRRISLPKGTTASSPERGTWVFTLPCGSVVQVKGYLRAAAGAAAAESLCGTLDDCSVKARGSLVATGTRGALAAGPKPAGGVPLEKVPPADYMKVEGAVVWLPAVLSFQPARVFNRLALTRLAPPEPATDGTRP